MIVQKRHMKEWNKNLNTQGDRRLTMYMNKHLGRFIIILMSMKQSNLTVLAGFTK